MQGKVEKKLLSIEHVSRLTFKDEELFRIAFPKNSIQYARSWLYVLRASHSDKAQLGYKYVDKNLIAVIGYRKKVIYLTPFNDKTHGVALKKLCHILLTKTGKKILIKKLDLESYEQFSQLEKSDNQKNLLEDDSCPETVIQLNKLFISESGEINPIAKRFIRKVKKIENSSIHFEIIENIKVVPMRQIERFFAKNKEKYASYMPMINYLYKNKNYQRYKIMLFFNNKHLWGVFLGEMFSTTDMGLYCGVTIKKIPGTTEWMDSQFFKKMFFEGIQTVYLGGSEREGVAWYINKLLPYKPSYFVKTIMYNESELNNKPEIIIRVIKENDLRNVSELYCNFYNSIDKLGEHWTKETAHMFIISLYKRQPDLFFVAEYNKKIVGAIVAAIQPWWDGNHLVKGEIFIDQNCSNKGIDKKLLKKFLTTARIKYHAVTWDVNAPITNSHPLVSFQKLGFIETPSLKAITGDINTILKRL